MNLIKPLLLLCFMLAVQSTFAQDLKKQVADDACDCLHEKKKGKIDDFEAVTGECIETAVMQNLASLAEEYGMDNLDGEFGEKFGEELGMTLVGECPLFMEMIMKSEGMGDISESSKFDDMASPTAAKVSKKACKCLSKIKDPSSDDLDKCVTTNLEKFEKKFVKENDKQDLTDSDMKAIAGQVFDKLDSACPSFQNIKSMTGGGAKPGSSADLAAGISDDACDCFQEVDLDLPSKELDAASEKCIENATLSNMDLIIENYGPDIANDDFADKLLEDIGADLMMNLMTDCPKFMEIIQRVDD